MSCNCNNDYHRVTNVSVTTTNVVLTVTNPNNIGNMETFNLICCKPVSSLVTTSPLPVQIVLNGETSVDVKNAYGLPLMSNVVPYGCTKGKFIIDSSGETPETYVILKTPCYA